VGINAVYQGARALGPQLMNKLWFARNLAGRRAAMGANPTAWRWGKEMLRPAYDRSPQFLQRFASNLVNTGNLEKGIMTTGTAALGLANQEEEGPLRAYGRPAAQFGGGILGTALGGATGFFADTPFSPVADFTLGAAGGAAGWETGGRLFDKLVPPKGVNNSNAINTGMANIPVGTKEAELEMRQEQGGYIPPGMGVPTQSGGVQSLYDSDRAAWLAKTANSPAQQSGAWDSAEGREQLWQQHLMNQDFQQAKKTGTLEDFATKYPNSQTAQRMNWDPRQGRRF